MMSVSSLRRASRAAATLPSISGRGMTPLPEKCPHFFGKIWSSICSGGGAGALEQAHGALHVERIAEARVDVDDERQGADVADPRRGLGELGHGQEPEVGHAELRVGDAGAGQVDRLVAEILDNARDQRVGGAGHQQRPPLLDELTKRRAALRLWQRPRDRACCRAA